MHSHYKAIIIRICFLTSFLTCCFCIFVAISPEYEMLITERFLYSSIIILPLFLAIYLINSVIDDRNKRQKNLKIMWWFMFLYYVVQLCYMLFFAKEFSRNIYNTNAEPYLTALQHQWMYCTNIIPFQTIKTMMNTFSIPGFDYSFPYINLIGNFVAFMPFAFFLPFFSKYMRKTIIFTLTIVLLITFVEVTQLLTLTGSLDIDDFILNFSGVIMLYGFLKIPWLQHLIKKLKG